jgi:hypothetical protein
MSTQPSGGIVNSLYVKENADTTRVDATFWITRWRDPHGNVSWRLHYTQTVILEFDGIQWPHTSVATLEKVGRCAAP